MEYGWDGEWFLRAYDDFGKKMGSHECEEGKIFIEPQGFAVMGGVGKETGADLKALESVDKYLSGRLQGKRWYLLPQQCMDHLCRSICWPRR